LAADSLVGVYTARFDSGVEDLWLLKGGRFRQVFHPALGAAVTRDGRWSFDAPSKTVYLQDYLVLSDGYCHGETTGTPGTAVMDPERAYLLFGPIRLGPDEGCPLRAK
jgi:hypothetical protein